MGKGGGSAPPSSQTVTQTNLPEYARPYFEDLLQRGQAESNRAYTPYSGQRVEGFTPGQTALQTETLGMRTPGQFGTATGMVGTGGGLGTTYGTQGMAAGQQAMGYGAAGAMTAIPALGYGATGAGLGTTAAGAGANYAQMATNPNAMAAYMSPYMQNAVNVQKNEAIRDASKANLGANLASARQGTYGGARQLLGTTERARALDTQLSNIQASGTQRAYEQAQQAQQYGANLGLQGLQAGMQGTQIGLQGIQEAQRAAQLGIQGAQAGMQGAQVGLQGAQQLTQAGATLGELGSAEQQANLARLQAQQGVAGQQQAMGQQGLDLAYADFLRQRDYPLEQLGYYSNLMRGMPIQLGSTSTTYAAPPNQMAQLAGLGTGAYALSKLAGMGSAKGGLVSLGLHQMANSKR